MENEYEDYRTIKTGDVRNAGFKMELNIPIDDAGNIDALVDQEVSIHSEGFVIIGTLEKTQTVVIKGEGIYKKLAIQANSIIHGESEETLLFPDKKDQFEVPVTIRY